MEFTRRDVFRPGLPTDHRSAYMRSKGYKTYIVTGGGQDFVRVYSEKTYGIPAEQVVGTARGTTFDYDSTRRPFLTKVPKLLLNDDKAGKPEGIHLMISRWPYAAFGNSVGDQQMLEYTKAGMASGSPFWSSTTMQTGNMPTAPPRICRTAKSAFSRRGSTMKPIRMAGPV